MSQLFDPDDLIDPTAVRRGTHPKLPKPMTPRRDRTVPQVTLGDGWEVIASAREAPIAHYVSSRGGNGGSTLLCGSLGRILEVEVARFDACAHCVKLHRAGHHLRWGKP